MPHLPGCLPALTHPAAVLTRLDGKGAHAVIVEGPATAAIMVFDPRNGGWLASGGNGLTHIPIGGATAQDSVACVTVAFYAPNQINREVPAIPSGQSIVTLGLASPDGVTAQRTLQVAAVSPSLATNSISNYATCDGYSLQEANVLSVYAMVFNQDGTLNSCGNPATVGSRMSVLLNGAGLQAPQYSIRVRTRSLQ